MAASVIGALTSISANRFAVNCSSSCPSRRTRHKAVLSPHESLSLSFILFFEMLLQIDFRPLKSLNLIRLIIIDIISIAFGDSTAEEKGTFLQLNCAQYDCLSGCSKICNGSFYSRNCRTSL